MPDVKGGDMDAQTKADASNYDRVTPSRQANQITLTRVNTPTRNILRKFDDNGDGRIDASEIQNIVTTLVAEKFKSKAFKIGLIILCIFTTVLLGAMFGLTWAVVAALKDTQVQDRGGASVLVTNDKYQNPILVGNMDLTVDSKGKMVSRENSTAVATSTLQTPGVISSSTPFDKLLSMQNLVFVTADQARYSLAIQGVARVPSSATNGYIVRFQTAAGTLSLENDTWSVSATIGPMLDNLFTASDGRGRRLVEVGLYFYVICEAGECGDAIPCGLPGLDACPKTTSILDPSPGSKDDGTEPNDVNTGFVGGVCSSPTPAVNSCFDGVNFCYGPGAISTQVSRYKLQYGCTSACGTNWYRNLDGWCEGTSPKTFCCI